MNTPLIDEPEALLPNEEWGVYGKNGFLNAKCKAIAIALRHESYWESAFRRIREEHDALLERQQGAAKRGGPTPGDQGMGSPVRYSDGSSSREYDEQPVARSEISVVSDKGLDEALLTLRPRVWIDYQDQAMAVEIPLSQIPILTDMWAAEFRPYLEKAIATYLATREPVISMKEHERQMDILLKSQRRLQDELDEATRVPVSVERDHYTGFNNGPGLGKGYSTKPTVSVEPVVKESFTSQQPVASTGGIDGESFEMAWAVFREPTGLTDKDHFRLGIAFYEASRPERESVYPLFKLGTFTSHSGLVLPDKIDCDALTDADWDAHAAWLASRLTFQRVMGIPSGGVAFARALEKYASPEGHWHMLIVDDVLTTGKSMYEARENYPGAAGAVLFSRTADVPNWIVARFIEQGWKL